jgi:hypothetical protein
MITVMSGGKVLYPSTSCSVDVPSGIVDSRTTKAAHDTCGGNSKVEGKNLELPMLCL